MKRSKKLLTLLLVLVVLAGLTALVPVLLPDEQEVEEDTSFILISVNADEVTEISWDYSESLTFTRSGDDWVYADDNTFPLDVQYIDTILDTISQISADKTIEDPEDLDQYGLEAPLCTVSFTAGESYSLSIGEETSLGGQRYLSIGDGNVYLVDSSILDCFSYELFDLLEYESIPYMYDPTELIVESSSQSYDLVKLEDSGIAYSDEYVWFLESSGSYLTVDTELSEALIETFADMYWGQCITYNASDSALTQYGLDTPYATITLHYIETVEVETGEYDDDGNPITESQERNSVFILEIGNETDDGCYARISGSKMVYLIDSSIRDDLCDATYNDLRPDEVLLLDSDAITSMDILLGDEVYSLLRTSVEVTDDDGNVTEETVFTLDGEEIDGDQVLTSLLALSSTGYADSIPDEEAEIAFVLYQDNEIYPEITLYFYAYDSSSCVTVLNGQATVFVAKSDITSLVEDVTSLVSE